MSSWIEQHIQKRTQYIPRFLHLIWVGKSEQPDYLAKHIQTWKELMPDWTIRLWTNEDLTTDEIPGDILAKIHEADKGVEKADILRYCIVEKYGGFYMDADVEPTRSLEPLLFMSDLVICHHAKITWKYIGNTLFGASPHHPVLQKAMSLCLTANLNTSEPHMNTGPHLFGTAISLVPPPNQKYMLLDLDCFYWPEGGMTPNRFGSHFFAKSWET
jgi:mannosyltransferase OCH1-like enzyme